MAPIAAKMATTAYSEVYGVDNYNWVENNATDSDTSTHYMSYHTGRADSTNPERFIVELGASIPVSLIRYISNAGEGKAENFSISVANNGDFSDRVTLMSLTDNINIEGRNKLLPVGGYYRYVLIEGNTAAHDISVSEIEIFADASCVQSSEVFEVSAGLSAMDYQKSGSSPGTASDLTTAGNIITYQDFAFSD